MKPLREILAHNIDRLIAGSDLNVREIAAALKVSETTVHRWKAKKDPIPPDVENLDALAKLLRVEPTEFYKSEENVIPVYGNTLLKRYMVIPDSVMKLIADLDGDYDHGMWAGVEGVLKVAIDDQQKRKQSAKNA